jgi:hypothetical protein
MRSKEARCTYFARIPTALHRDSRSVFQIGNRRFSESPFSLPPIHRLGVDKKISKIVVLALGE